MELYIVQPGESIELRAFPIEGERRRQEFFKSWEELYARAAEIELDYDVYFGVCPRVPNQQGVLSGGNQNVTRVPVLWLDADAKEPHSKESRLTQIQPWKPTTIVDSGHGYHVYWRLAEDVLPNQAQRFLKALATQLGCDDTSDPARILRVPGTKNYKTSPARFVDVVQNSGPTHHLHEMEARLTVEMPMETQERKNHSHRLDLMLRHGIDENGSEIDGEVFGGRDVSVFEAACFWKNQHTAYEVVLERCHSLNQNFRPPLPANVVIGKVKSAFNWPAPPQITEVIEPTTPSTSLVVPVSQIPITAFTVQSMEDIRRFEEPPTEWMAKGVLARGHIVYTMNPPKSGKTTVALNLALRMAAGKSGAGLFIEKPYRVLFLQPMGDMHPTLTREWTKKIATGLKLDNDITFDLAVLGERSDHFQYLNEHAEKYDLVVVDTISRLFPAVDAVETHIVSTELDKIRRLRMAHPNTCWLYLVQVGKNSLAHMRGAIPGFAARGNSAISEVFDDALQLIVPTNDIERDETLGLNLTRHIAMMGRGASDYRQPWRTRFDPETHVIEWVQDLTYDEAIEESSVGGSSAPSQTKLAADLLGRMFLDAKEATGKSAILSSEAYKIGEENGYSKRVMKLALNLRGGDINPPRGPKSMWWDSNIVEVVEAE